MTAHQKTVSEIVRERFETLTRAERQLAHSLMENYPVSGLTSITAIAKNADVSMPTVTRMVQKLGFKGFHDFKAALRSELEAKISNPIVKHDLWAENAPDTHILNRFAESVVQNLQQTLAHLDPETFDKACGLLADPERSIFIAGGRISRNVADYFFSLMQMVRPKVTLVRSGATAWPDFLLDIKPNDVLVMFDIRRYETHILRLAELAAEKDAKIIIFTDQWGSPIAKHASHCFNCWIEAPSAWDSVAVMLTVVETMVAQIQSTTWDSTYERMKDLERMFDRTGLFRKFKKVR